MTSRSAITTRARPRTSPAGTVISAGKLHFDGFLGWLAWLFIHIGFLTGYRIRIGAMLGWWFALYPRLAPERTFNIDDLPVTAADP